MAGEAEPPPLPSDSINLFRLVHEYALSQALNPFEQVEAVTGYEGRRFVLTSHGRLLVFDDVWSLQAEATLPAQKKGPSGECISHLAYIAPTGCLLILHNFILNILRIDGQREVIFSRRDVAMVALSESGTQRTWPNHVVAYVTTKGQVVHSVLGEREEHPLWKWKPESKVTAIAFEGVGMCCTTLTGCYVRSLEKEGPPSLVFSLDVPTSATGTISNTPDICHINEGEFVVVGAISGIALFVDARTLAAARPPITVSSTKIRAKKNAHHLFLHAGHMLNIYDVAHQFVLRETVPLPAKEAFLCMAGDAPLLIVKAPDANVYYIQEKDWVQQAREMADLEKWDLALEVLRNNIPSSDEQRVLARDLLVRLGLNKLSKGEGDEGAELLVKGKVAPHDIEHGYAGHFDADPTSVLPSLSEAILLREVIGRVLEEDIQPEDKLEWNTLCVMLEWRACDSPWNLVELFDKALQFDVKRLLDFFQSRKLVNEWFALLAKDAATYTEDDAQHLRDVLSLSWLDSAYHPRVDKMLYLEWVKRIADRSIQAAEEFIDNVMDDEVAKTELLKWLASRATSFACAKMLSLFDGHAEEIKVLHSFYKTGTTESEVFTRLACRIADRLGGAVVQMQDVEGLRYTLSALIVNHSDILPCLLPHLAPPQKFPVEIALARNISDPEMALDALLPLLPEPLALHAVEQVIEHSKPTHPHLLISLLRKLKMKCDANPSLAAEQRVPELMAALVGSAREMLGSPEALIDILPDRTPLTLFLPLISREVLRVMAEDSMAKIAYGLSQGALKGRAPLYPRTSFLVTETTLCPVCNKNIEPTSSLTYLPSKKVIHTRCHTNKDVCPVTNQILRT